MGELVTKKKMAAILGFQERTLTNYQQEGMPIESKGKRGQASQYDTAAVISWLIEREVRLKLERQSKGNQGKGDIDSDYERARLTRAQADHQEMKNAVARGELEPTAVIRLVLERVAVQVAAILETIPLKVKRRLPKLTASELEVIKREVIKAQNLAARAGVARDELLEHLPDDSGGPFAADEAGTVEPG